MSEKGERMINKEADIMQILYEVEKKSYELPIHTRIMSAESAKELLDLNLKTDEVMNLFQHIELLGMQDERERFIPSYLLKSLEALRPVRRKRHLFI